MQYAHFDNNAWQIERVDYEPAVGRHTSLVLDDFGRPHIGYSGAWYGELRYAWYDGGGLGSPQGWQIEEVDSVGSTGGYTDLVIDGDGRPQLVYLDAEQKSLVHAWRVCPPTPPITFTWDMGDQTLLEGAVVSHTYDLPGTYAVRVTASAYAGTLQIGSRYSVTVVEALPPLAAPER
ncbi:MAG: PKD domain-containing protein [Chloroflexia bacterium]|nr:PKD domain-containing protein [Chloroflexia bacterium]